MQGLSFFISLLAAGCVSHAPVVNVFCSGYSTDDGIIKFWRKSQPTDDRIILAQFTAFAQVKSGWRGR